MSNSGNVNAAMTLLEKWPEKIQALNGIRTHDLCVTGAMPSTTSTEHKGPILDTTALM